MSQDPRSRRATIDVINFWCVAVLIISAASVAGVVGAAVFTGEFEDRNFDIDSEDDNETAGVITELNPDGTTRVRWSDEGQAESIEIAADGETLETLEFVGDEVTVERSSFEVIAISADGSRETIESVG